MPSTRPLCKQLALLVATALVLTGPLLAIKPSSAAQSPTSLKGIKPEFCWKVNRFVLSKTWAVALGKALFWDQQMGSDGQACASCHFHAGCDNRVKNTLSPGPITPSFDFAGPNYTLTLADFPFTRFNDPNDRYSGIAYDTRAVVSSQGVFQQSLADIVPGSPFEIGAVIPDDVFNVDGINVRRVATRNTPTVINAVYNYRNCWDGRAMDVYNGQNHLGEADPNAFIYWIKNGKVKKAWIDPDFSSLASQSNEPPTNINEMSYTGRMSPKVGKKMLSLKPLGLQMVDATDSVLANRVNRFGTGLTIGYSEMIKNAFRPEYWNNTSKIIKIVNGAPKVFDKPKRPLKTDEYTLMEYNFPMFFGLAVQAYESTLISDDSRFDRYMNGDTKAMTPQELHGLAVFTDQDPNEKGHCVDCHGGPLFSNATTPHIFQDSKDSKGPQIIQRGTTSDGEPAIFDNGFYNIGVRPTYDDIGVGGVTPDGVPLSLSRQAVDLGRPIASPALPGERVAVDGAFKTPTLRNVELTGPFFHNGGKATLRQVVDFFDRGGDFSDQNIGDLPPAIQELNLSDQTKEDLVAFLKSLTDERVRRQSKPFDHPQLFVPNGHPGDHSAVAQDGAIGQAMDDFIEIPATGKFGGPPIQPFEEQFAQ